MQIGTIDNRIRRLIALLAVAQAYLYRAQAVPVWTCADGRVIPITEMDDKHLRNAINLIERGAPHAASRAPILPALHAEHERRRVAALRAQGRDSDGHGLRESAHQRWMRNHPGATAHANTGRVPGSMSPPEVRADESRKLVFLIDSVAKLAQRVTALEKRPVFLQDVDINTALAELTKRTRDLRGWVDELRQENMMLARLLDGMQKRIVSGIVAACEAMPPGPSLHRFRAMLRTVRG